MHYLKTIVLACAACAVVAAPIAMSDAALAKSKHHKSAPRSTENKQTKTGGQPGGSAAKN